MRGLFEATEIVAAVGGEPRMSAALLASRLGISRRQTMMRLIERNDEALRRFGEYLATVAKYSGRGRGQPEKDYLLNEGQAIYIASRSGTPLATEVHIALVMVFMEWRAGRLSVDDAELEEKRAYYRALPQVHRDRAEARVAALERFEARVESGEPTTRALRAVAAEAGFSERSLWGYRRNVRMVHRSDRAAALAPLWNLPKGPRVECHPEALRLFLDLASRPSRITDCYRRMTDEAALRGWSPIPSERTLRRVAAQVVPRLSGPRPA